MSVEQPFDSVDPITQVYRQIWVYLEAETRFSELVPLQNRIKYDGNDRSPEKDEHATADFPEVLVRPAGGTDAMRVTSDRAAITKTWQLMVRSGDKRATKVLFPVEWEMLKAAAKMKRDDLDFAFVHDVSGDTHQYRDRNREDTTVRQWASVADITVDMRLAISDLEG